MNGRVFVIGLGLIGGSLALCIKKEHPNAEIVGYDISSKQAGLAKALGVIDASVQTIREGAVTADLIIISAPVKETLKIIWQLADLPLKQDVLITDTGSTTPVR